MLGKGAKKPITAARGRKRTTSPVLVSWTSLSIFEPESRYKRTKARRVFMTRAAMRDDEAGAGVTEPSRARQSGTAEPSPDVFAASPGS